MSGLGASSTRLALIAYLGSVESATPREISDAVGISPHYVRRHLLELEEAGLVTADLPRELRSGRRPGYSLDRAAYAALLAALATEALGAEAMERIRTALAG